MKFGIIGCGRIAETHARQMAELGELAAVCDPLKSGTDKLRKKYGARAYSTYIEMFERETDLQVISVCSPNGLHAEHSIAALLNGSHVICEKPMALTVSDCQKMIDTALEANRQLFVVKQNRYNPPVAALKQLIVEGRLGKILSLQLNCFWNRNAAYYENSWKGTLKLDGGTLFTQFSHFIDLLYWLMGDVKFITGLNGNLAHQEIIDFEDTGVIILQFMQGALATINYTVNCYNKNMEGSLTVFGEKGTVKVGGEYLNVLEYQEIEGYVIKNIPDSREANHYGQYKGSMSNHHKVFKNVIEVLEQKAAIMTRPEDGLKTVELINRIYASSKQPSMNAQNEAND